MHVAGKARSPVSFPIRRSKMKDALSNAIVNKSRFAQGKYMTSLIGKHSNVSPSKSPAECPEGKYGRNMPDGKM